MNSALSHVVLFSEDATAFASGEGLFNFSHLPGFKFRVVMLFAILMGRVNILTAFAHHIINVVLVGAKKQMGLAIGRYAQMLTAGHVALSTHARRIVAAVKHHLPFRYVAMSKLVGQAVGASQSPVGADNPVAVTVARGDKKPAVVRLCDFLPEPLLKGVGNTEFGCTRASAKSALTYADIVGSGKEGCAAVFAGSWYRSISHAVRVSLVGSRMGWRGSAFCYQQIVRAVSILLQMRAADAACLT